MEVSREQGGRNRRHTCRAKRPEVRQICPEDYGDGADRGDVTRGKVERMEPVGPLKNEGRVPISRPSPAENKFQPALEGLPDGERDDA